MKEDFIEMIDHLLAEDDLGGETDSARRESSVSRLSSISRPSWSTPLGMYWPIDCFEILSNIFLNLL